MIIKDKKILFQLNIEKQLLFADITRSKIRIKTELWKVCDIFIKKTHDASDPGCN